MKHGSRQARSCDGKEGYTTMKRAARAANRMNDTLIAKNHVVPYKCQFCPKYHVGRSRENKKHHRFGRHSAKPHDDESDG